MKYYYKEISEDKYIKVSVKNDEIKDAEFITKDEYLKEIEAYEVIYQK